MGRIQTTIEMAKSSWQILKADRELVWLPVISFLISLLVMVVLVAPVLALSDGLSDEATLGPLEGLLLFIAAVAVTSVTVFFQAAVVAATGERLAGGDPTVRSGISAASGRVPQVIGWALTTAVVGSLVRMVRERGGIVTALLGGLAEMAWNLVTFLAVPVLVFEGSGPIDTVKRSTALFRSTWGENVTAQVGFGLLGFVAVIPGLVVGFGLVSLGGVIAGIGIVLAAAWIGVVAAVVSTLDGIFRTVLYRFATDGSLPEAFSHGELGRAFDR